MVLTLCVSLYVNVVLWHVVSNTVASMPHAVTSVSHAVTSVPHAVASVSHAVASVPHAVLKADAQTVQS